jgi:hypothetical protein
MDLQLHLNTHFIPRSDMLTAGCKISLCNEGCTTYCITGFDTACRMGGRSFITGRSLENFTSTTGRCVTHLGIIQYPVKNVLLTIHSIKFNTCLVSQIYVVYKVIDSATLNILISKYVIRTNKVHTFFINYLIQLCCLRHVSNN